LVLLLWLMVRALVLVLPLLGGYRSLSYTSI
jgi:hypothetical protein